MYRVTKSVSFCYGHRLLNYDGKCRHLHGHNADAVITLESETLDERGMLVDFSDIKALVNQLQDQSSPSCNSPSTSPPVFRTTTMSSTRTPP